MNRYLQDVVKTHRLNGVISVETDQALLFRGAFGLSSLEYGVPNTLETKFLLGSNTKLFTAVAALQIVEHGGFSLDTPVRHFFPKHRHEMDDSPTVHHLLSHTAGIINFWDLDCFGGDIQMIELEEERLLTTLFSRSTGGIGQYSYSNSGYYLLGLIIERATGVPYTEYIQKQIFDPLNMKESGVYDQESVVKDLATGYRLKESHLVAAPYYEMRKLYACGGIYSTIADVDKWLQGLREHRVLTAESFQKICTPVDSSYGYGCRVAEEGSLKYICHDGYVKGHYSHIRLYPTVGLRMQIVRNSSALSSTSADEVEPDSVCSHVAEMVGVSTVESTPG